MLTTLSVVHTVHHNYRIPWLCSAVHASSHDDYQIGATVHTTDGTQCAYLPSVHSLTKKALREVIRHRAKNSCALSRDKPFRGLCKHHLGALPIAILTARAERSAMQIARSVATVIPPIIVTPSLSCAFVRGLLDNRKMFCTAGSHRQCALQNTIWAHSLAERADTPWSKRCQLGEAEERCMVVPTNQAFAFS